MSSTPEYSPQADWLDALQVVLQSGHKDFIQRLWQDVEILPELSSRILPAAVFQKTARGILVTLDKGIADLPRVERVEILTFVAAHSWRLLINASDEEEIILCKYLGCCSKATSTVHERWRLIAGELDPRENKGYRSASLVSQLFEDRPACKWCSSPMCTGTRSYVRPDLHANCLEYINKVVRPQMKAAREAEQKAYSQAEKNQ